MDLLIDRQKSLNFHYCITNDMKRNTRNYQFQPFPNEPIPKSELEVDDSDSNYTTNYNFANADVGNFTPIYQQSNLSQLPINNMSMNNYIQHQVPSYSQSPNYPVSNSPTKKYLPNNQHKTTAYQPYQLPSQPGYSLPDSSYPLEETERTIAESSSINPQKYPDMTTLINSNSGIRVPLVESAFVDSKSCSVCGKKISRDMLRHMRTHQSVARFKCNFLKNQCSHKSRRFNRPYDHKKHLLNRHFKFDSPEVKKLHNLNDKLGHWGTCPCGLRYVAKEWLEKHILATNTDQKCPLLE